MAMSPKPVTADVELRTLGGLRVLVDGEDRTSRFEPQRLALLTYLFHERRPLVPAEVLTLLGRAAGSEDALATLVEDVRAIRRELTDVQIAHTRDTIQALSGVRIDTVELDAALDAGKLDEVERLLAGPFLQGFRSDSERFDAWATRERQRLQRAWSHAIGKAAARDEERKRWESAARWRKLVEKTPPPAAAKKPSAAGPSAPKRPTTAARPSPEKPSSAPVKPTSQKPSSAPMKPTSQKPSSAPVKPTSQKPSSAPVKPTSRKRPSGAAKAAPPNRPAAAAKSASPERPTAPPPERPEPEAVRPAAAFDAAPAGFGPAEPVRPTFIRPTDPVVRRRLKKSQAPEVFTDSWLVYLLKTFWARMTTPRARARYRETAHETAVTFRETGHVLTGATLATLRFLGQLLVWIGFHARELGRVVLRLMGRGARQAGRTATDIGSTARRVPGRIARRSAELGAGVGTRVATRVSAASSVASSAASSALASTRPGLVTLGSRWRSAAEAVEERTRDWGRARRSALRTALGAVGAGLAAAFRAVGRSVRGTISVLWRSSRGLARVLASAIGSIGRVRPRTLARAGLGLSLALVVLLAGPVAVDMGKSLWHRARDVAGSVSDLRLSRPQLPDVSLPKVTLPSMPEVSLPDVSLAELPVPDLPSRLDPGELRMPSAVSGVPDAVTDSRLRLLRILTGPLLPPGGRLVIADFQLDSLSGADESLGPALALALETYLAESPYFSVVTRERAIRMLRPGEAASGLALNEAAALVLARDAEYRAVLVGRVEARDTSHRLEIRVVGADGRMRYRTTAEVRPESLLSDLPATALRLRRALGEPLARTDANAEMAAIFSDSRAAALAFLRAREHLNADRYTNALAAAREALVADPEFALAYRVMAEAHALAGRHGLARRALEEAWQRRDRLPQRERMRVEADRHALSRRDLQAVAAYEALFQRYRDDAIALKSQYLIRRRMDPATGEGNLYIAYARDPSDWPSLRRLARFLDYRGPLPDLRSLQPPAIARTP